MNRSDKREMDRYDLNVPAFVLPRTGTEAGRVVEFKTKNISSGGAFLITDNPFRLNTEVDVEVHISLFDAGSNITKKSDIHVSGAVVRIETSGMAVKFDNKFRIVSAG